MNRDDELDDPFIARYADRIADDREVLWRADFARVLDYEDRGYEEDPALLLQARQIRDRWAADPEVAPRWIELDEINAAWIYAPEAMKQAHEVTMPGGLRPPGMDDTRWSSHMQARELTGHGAWPGHEPTYSTDSFERHEPMTETTDRHDQADEFTSESDTEQLMRADFTRWAAVGHHRDLDDYHPADDAELAEHSATWIDHAEDRWLEEWVALADAYLDYRDDAQAADAKRAQFGDTLGPVQTRSWEQARDLTVNGISRDEAGLITSHYVTRMPYERAEEIRAQQRTLADVRREQAAVERSGEESALGGFEAAPLTHEEAALNSDAGQRDPMTFYTSYEAQHGSDRARNNPENPVPSFGASVAARTSALAGYTSNGNAVAAAMGRQAERAGAER